MGVLMDRERYIWISIGELPFLFDLVERYETCHCPHLALDYFTNAVICDDCGTAYGVDEIGNRPIASIR